MHSFDSIGGGGGAMEILNVLINIKIASRLLTVH